MAKSKTPLGELPVGRGDVENWSESCFPPSLLFPILCNLTYSRTEVRVGEVGWRWDVGGVCRGLQRTLCLVMVGWKGQNDLPSVATQGSSGDLISHTSGSHLISAVPACLDSSRIVICFQ